MLQSLREHPYTGGEQEVIVVDNASADGSAAMVATEFPEVVLIANAANENFARGTNQAVVQATGDLILLLNPDVQMSQGALDTMAAKFDSITMEDRLMYGIYLLAQLKKDIKNPSVRQAAETYPNPHSEVSANGQGAMNRKAAVVPRLLYPDGQTQASVRGFPEPWLLLWEIIGLARLFPRMFGGYRSGNYNYESDGLAPQPMASCLLIRREVWDEAGPMDERFPLYFNDVDWCLRVRDSCHWILYTPDAAVTHGGGGTTKRVRKAATWESHRALLRFYDKHYRATTPRPLYALLTTLIIVGAWARTGRWGESLGRNGGETTPESLARDLERAN